MKKKILYILFWGAMLSLSAQNLSYDSTFVKPRLRVIIDNDFGGDPDGLFQLAHHLLSPTVDIRGIIASQHHSGGFYGYPGDVTYSFEQMNGLLDEMGLSGKYPLFKGGAANLKDTDTSVESDAVRFIIKEALREDTKQPLYVVCGAGLTNIASAYLVEPKIAERIVLVWIGGPEYEALSKFPIQKHSEYNLSIDLKAAQVIFNKSNIPIWQVPRDSYRQALYSYSEIIYRIKPQGRVGAYLVDKLEDLLKRAKGSLGEAYALGDSPLVLLTALQSSWELDPSSSQSELVSAPKINDNGFYENNSEGRQIRVFTHLDVRLMFEDMVAKLALFSDKISRKSEIKKIRKYT